MNRDTRDSIIAGFISAVLCFLAIFVIAYFWGDKLVSDMVTSLTRF